MKTCVLIRKVRLTTQVSSAQGSKKKMVSYGTFMGHVLGVNAFLVMSSKVNLPN